LPSQKIVTKIIRSSVYDPWFNLSLEEYLLNQVEPNEVILYLWQNDNTVVVGRNQNAWKECDTNQMELDGCKLSRRLSGGGAVFHDLGNLNYTFIMDKKIYDLDRQVNIILQSLSKHGVKALFSGRNDLTVNNKKISGNAFYFLEEVALHHGTLLVDTDFQKLVKYLNVSKEKIKSKGIDSVRSRVANLVNLKQGITTEKIVESMKECFIENYGGTNNEIIFAEDRKDGFQELYDKYGSWEWRYGETPHFDIVFQNRFPWGELEIGLTLKKGKIDCIKVYSDAMNADMIKGLMFALKGCILRETEILERLKEVENFSEEDKLIQEIQEWFVKEINTI